MQIRRTATALILAAVLAVGGLSACSGGSDAVTAVTPADGGGVSTARGYDALGRVVHTSHLAPGTSHLDLNGLPPGLYTVRTGTQARRLVVE